LLELEITDVEKEIILPPWVTDSREVTGEPEFSNFRIAQALARK